MPLWEDEIASKLLDGKNIIIAAYGNSLRALSKYIEQISDEDIMGLEMTTGQPANQLSTTSMKNLMSFQRQNTKILINQILLSTHFGGCFFYWNRCWFLGLGRWKRVISDATMTIILEIMVLVRRKIDVLRFGNPIKRHALLALWFKVWFYINDTYYGMKKATKGCS